MMLTLEEISLDGIDSLISLGTIFLRIKVVI